MQNLPHAGKIKFYQPSHKGLLLNKILKNGYLIMQANNKNSFIPIGLMLFALFFGAGNLIFPGSMGQAAGQNVWWALLGFCITGVGLPLLEPESSEK